MTRNIRAYKGEQRRPVSHDQSVRYLNRKRAGHLCRRKALERVRAGSTGGLADRQDGKRPLYRYVMPLLVEKSCPACHARQGYKLGDIRGGYRRQHPGGGPGPADSKQQDGADLRGGYRHRSSSGHPVLMTRELVVRLDEVQKAPQTRGHYGQTDGPQETGGTSWSSSTKSTSARIRSGAPSRSFSPRHRPLQAGQRRLRPRRRRHGAENHCGRDENEPQNVRPPSAGSAARNPSSLRPGPSSTRPRCLPKGSWKIRTTAISGSQKIARHRERRRHVPRRPRTPRPIRSWPGPIPRFTWQSRREGTVMIVL